MKFDRHSNVSAKKFSPKNKTTAARHYLLVLIIAPLHIYRYAVSPFLPPACRFYPTCSAYALEALKNHGFVFALWLIAKRLARCHPFCECGYDPVPKKE